MRGVIDHPDYAQPVMYDLTVIPDCSNDVSVAATIELMKRYAVADSMTDVVQRTVQALKAGCGCVGDYIGNVFMFAQRSMYFQRDELTGSPIAPDAIEVLTRPADVCALAERGQVLPGDCDCFSMLVVCLLTGAGVPSAFVTISSHPSAANEFSHVYVAVYPVDGERVAVDASHGKYAGWEAPNYGRLKEWPLVGRDDTGASPMAMLSLLLAAIGLFFTWRNFEKTNRLEMGEM